MIEIARKLRSHGSVDRLDADLTIQAVLDLERDGAQCTNIDAVWRQKARLLSARIGRAA